MTDIRIGDLRHLMRLEAVSRVEDGGGGASETWGQVAEVWAALRPMTGSEIVEAHRLAGRVTHEVVIRHRVGVEPSMRFVLGARVFDIKAAINVSERGRWLRCLVVERVS